MDADAIDLLEVTYKALAFDMPAVLCLRITSPFQSMLVYDPARRISSRKALHHPYFDDVCLGVKTNASDVLAQMLIQVDTTNIPAGAYRGELQLN